MTQEKKRKEPPADAAPSPGDDGERRKNKEMTDPIRPSQIKNKDKRSELHAKLKREKKDQKRKDAREREQAARRAAELGEEASALVELD
jgi:ribosome production factor 1